MSVHHAPDAQFCMRCGGMLAHPQPIQFQPPGYRQLEALLAAGKWREADEETTKQMLEVANRTKQGYLDVASIDNFPCEDLRAIDGLWVKYSNRRFGFSVQKRIYQSLGGTRDNYQQVWQSFCDLVGYWERGFGWLGYSDYNNLNFSNKAPEGHLPSVFYYYVDENYWAWDGELIGRRNASYSLFLHRGL